MKFIISTVAFVTLLGIIGAEDYRNSESASKHYCEMVKLWGSSNGEYGHPNYDQRDCRTD